jgi:hypothetical protein
VYSPIIDIFKSEWMQRMWVVLEYYQCQQACIMDGSNKIWRVKDPIRDRTPFLQDTFPRVVNGALWLLKISGRWGSTLSYFLSLEGSNLEAPAKLHNKLEKLCIGEALALIEGRQSQVVRDRFLAICIMSCPNLLAQDLETIPEDTPVPVFGFGAKRWLRVITLLCFCNLDSTSLSQIPRRACLPGCSAPAV